MPQRGLWNLVTNLFLGHMVAWHRNRWQHCDKVAHSCLIPVWCSGKAGINREASTLKLGDCRDESQMVWKMPQFSAELKWSESIVGFLKLYWFVFMRLGFLHLVPYSTVTAVSDWIGAIIRKDTARTCGLSQLFYWLSADDAVAPKEQGERKVNVSHNLLSVLGGNYVS